MTIFNAQTETEHIAYRNLRDADHNTELREFAETLWCRFEPYAELDFKRLLQIQTHQRFWEMYLGCSLLNAGHEPLPQPVAGPDFKLEANGQTIWVEATAVNSGAGINAVPDAELGQVSEVPHEQIILRLVHGFSKKSDKYREYLDRVQVAANDCTVIAINPGQIRQTIFEGDLPRIVSAVLPFGNKYVNIDKETLQIVDSGYEYRDHIKTASGARVLTNAFDTNEHAHISAVIASNSDAGMHALTPDGIGHDFVLVHNPLSINPLPRGFLPLGREIFMEGDDFKMHRHS